MAVEKEAAGLRSIAEKLRGHLEAVAAESGQRTQEEGLGCKRAEERLNRRRWQEAGSCEVELRRKQQTAWLSPGEEVHRL